MFESELTCDDKESHQFFTVTFLEQKRVILAVGEAIASKHKLNIKWGEPTNGEHQQWMKIISAKENNVSYVLGDFKKLPVNRF